MKLPLLLVDDDRASLESMKAMLNRLFRVLCAETNDPQQTALQIWRENADLQLAIIDLHMSDGVGRVQPEHAGLELISQMKKERPSARIAIRSGYQNHDNLADAIKMGADGFLGKGWERDSVLANVNFLYVWVTAGATLRALSQSIDARVPQAVGHTDRVRDLCRGLLVHLDDANPKNVDLAACLLGAELHDLGKLSLPDDILLGTGWVPARQAHELIERQTRFASLLRPLGPGFEKVERIISLYHRYYREPKTDILADYPNQKDLPRGDNLPLEARVLHLADALDNLLTGSPSHDLATALAVLWQQTELGVFDPKVTRALEQLVANDRGRLEAIYPTTDPLVQMELALYFNGQRMTAAQLQACLAVLARLYLPSGLASIRLAVAGVETVLVEGKKMVKVRLLGTEEDTRSAQELLEISRAEAQMYRTNPPSVLAYQADSTVWKTLPELIVRSHVS